jgi:hypothetical protein
MLEFNTVAELNDSANDSPGWDAIDDALRPIYGDREPLHFGTVLPAALGGPDPIHGISAYLNSAPAPHWHFVTYGFSELWQKDSDDLEVSGFGFELTFRLACAPNEERPPNWTFNFLQNLGRYVFKTGNPFGVGHTMPLNGPIELGSGTRIHAVTFALDPQLPPMDTRNGRVEFLQIVGLTMDELDTISSWNAQAFFGLRSRQDPLLITDLSRASWLKDAGFADEVRQRTELEGSSCGWLFLVLECDLDADPVCVRIQSIAVARFRKRLLGRLPFGRELALHGKNASVHFEPAAQSRYRADEHELVIELSDADLRRFADSLHAHAGVYPVCGIPNLVVEVLRTEIKDSDGHVVEVVE